jgi:hypothetical protein
MMRRNLGFVAITLLCILSFVGGRNSACPNSQMNQVPASDIARLFRLLDGLEVRGKVSIVCLRAGSSSERFPYARLKFVLDAKDQPNVDGLLENLGWRTESVPQQAFFHKDNVRGGIKRAGHVLWVGLDDVFCRG